jgi:hypothetical protein
MNVCMVNNWPTQMATLSYASIRLKDPPIRSHTGWKEVGRENGNCCRGLESSTSQTSRRGAHLDCSHSGCRSAELECSMHTSEEGFKASGYSTGGMFSLSKGKPC